MDSALHLIVSQVGDELAARRREMARLADLLAEQELELAELRSTLIRFQHRYFQVVGRRYAEMDELRARLARKRAERAPADERAAREGLAFPLPGRQDRSWLPKSQRRGGRGRREDKPASEEIKKLYRSIAVQIHPDRAKTEKSRAIRTALMAELNAAYAAGDTIRMQTILEEWQSSPESIAGEGPEAELLRLTRALIRMERRLGRIEKEIGRLQASPMGRLLRRVREAAARGKDLLDELAAELDLKIELARRELEEMEENS